MQGLLTALQIPLYLHVTTIKSIKILLTCALSSITMYLFYSYHLFKNIINPLVLVMELSYQINFLAGSNYNYRQKYETRFLRTLNTICKSRQKLHEILHFQREDIQTSSTLKGLSFEDSTVRLEHLDNAEAESSNFTGLINRSRSSGGPKQQEIEKGGLRRQEVPKEEVFRSTSFPSQRKFMEMRGI